MEIVYQSADQNLICGEALTVLEAMRKDGCRFDAVVTDPPYASGGLHTGTKHQATNTKYQNTQTVKRFHDFEGDARSQTGWLNWTALWLNACRQLLNPGAPVLMFCDWRQLGAAITAIECGGFIHRAVAVWDKKAGRPQPNGFRAQCEFVVVGSNGRRPAKSPDSPYLPGVFRHAVDTVATRRHLTQKPVSLLVELLAIVPAGGGVLDPFAGSGSTLQAARLCGLEGVGIEEQRRICEDAAVWLQDTTESKAAAA